MITEDKYGELVSQYPAFGKIGEKVKEIVRDQLDPSEEVRFAREAKVSGVDGLVYVTQKDVWAFWTMKMLIFFKFPAQQQFHLSQIRKVVASGSAVELRAEADPDNPDDDYEENSFVFAGTKDAEEFVELVRD